MLRFLQATVDYAGAAGGSTGGTVQDGNVLMQRGRRAGKGRASPSDFEAAALGSWLGCAWGRAFDAFASLESWCGGHGHSGARPADCLDFSDTYELALILGLPALSIDDFLAQFVKTKHSLGGERLRKLRCEPFPPTPPPPPPPTAPLASGSPHPAAPPRLSSSSSPSSLPPPPPPASLPPPAPQAPLSPPWPPLVPLLVPTPTGRSSASVMAIATAASPGRIEPTHVARLSALLAPVGAAQVSGIAIGIAFLALPVCVWHRTHRARRLVPIPQAEAPACCDDDLDDEDREPNTNQSDVT